MQYRHKKTFSLIEFLFLIVILGIISTQTTLKTTNSNLQKAASKVKLYLNYTRYISHLDNKYSVDDEEWFKKLWTVKFQNCAHDIGGFYFVVYSDKSGGTAHFKKEECLKDPLTNKYLYSNSDCEASHNESKYILLTKEYGVEKVNISCNSNNSLGQISFSYNGDIYSNLGDHPSKITQKCYITLFDKDNNSVKITIEPKTGYIY